MPTITKTITTEIEVDIDEDDIAEILEDDEKERSGEHDHLLRRGIEDRDWRQIEEFAEKIGVRFMRLRQAS